MIEVDFDFKQRLHEAELSKVIAEKLARVELWVSPITSGGLLDFLSRSDG
jgi:hypothetical protein